MAIRPSPVKRAAAPVRQQVLEMLRQEIIQSQLHPGDRLTERELCERYDVSRTSVREALRALEGEGLVTMVPNKGPIVTTVSAAEAAQIYQVRGALEGLAGSLFTRHASEAELDRLGKAADGIAKATKSGQLQRMLDAKSIFYDVLIDGAKNEVIRNQLRMLHTRVTFLRALSLRGEGRPEKSLEEIRAIVASARSRDAVAAWRACASHVSNAGAMALQQYAEQSGEIVHPSLLTALPFEDGRK